MGLRGVRVTYLYWLVCGLWLLAGLVGCGGDSGGGGSGNVGGDGGGGGTTTSGPTSQSGAVRVTLSDPSICKAPQSDLNRVFVTITLVRAHLSATAAPDDGGWVNLVDLRDSPQQIDLLSTPDTTCVLTVLGATTGVPPGAARPRPASRFRRGRLPGELSRSQLASRRISTSTSTPVALSSCRAMEPSG
jgi:hypothetical protein